MVAAAAVALALVAVGASCGSTTRSAARASRAANTASRGSSATSVAPTTTSIAATTTTTAPPPTTTSAPHATTPPPAVVAGPGIAVGDSVLEDVELYAPSTLASHGISINAAVGRQWPAGMAILSSLRTKGQLPAVVIVALGSNGRITAGAIDQMMQACAGAKRVVFMTVTGPLIGNNPIIEAGVARYPNAALADWNSLASAHPAWFAPDHVHVGPAGAAALGNLLASLS